jgi:hypothetical protein
MIKKSLFALSALLLALSCGSSVNPQLKAKIDSYNTAGRPISANPESS